jgi:RNA polymerase sigma-70 factor (ECF subfamily)
VALAGRRFVPVLTAPEEAHLPEASGMVTSHADRQVVVDAVDDDRVLRGLFDRARGGDGAALERLCRQMRPRLFRVAHAVLRDVDEADDVAQEALVRAVTRRFLFLGTGSVGGWMTRIALNLAKNRRRDRRRREEIVVTAPVSDLSARGALAQGPLLPDRVLEDAEERLRLRRAVEALPERQRDVVRLRAVAGLEFAAVAATLEISEANARVTFAAARKRLLLLVNDASPVAEDR